MSYHIRTTFRADGPVTIMARDVLRLLRQREDRSLDLPEDNFLDEARREAERLLIDSNPPFTDPAVVTLDPKKMRWSGNHAADSLSLVADRIRGRLEAVFVGEDGDVWGMVIDGGKVTPCSAEIIIKPLVHGT